MRRPIARDQNQRKRAVSSQVANWVNFVDPGQLKPVCWYDAADSSTIVESGGDVSQWNDKSGNGYHVTQGTGANQPTTGSDTINGLNVLTFNGTTDRLNNTAVPSSNRPHTYVIVAKENSGITATSSLINTLLNPTNQILALFLNQTAPNRRTNVFDGSGSVIGQVLNSTSSNIIYLKAQGSTSQFGLNGVYANVTTSGTVRNGGIRIGVAANDAGEFFSGQVAEVLYFNSALSDFDRDQLTMYLRRKWGI